nr:MAG TPA: hypothetical protein [Bacteriophage sp.]
MFLLQLTIAIIKTICYYNYTIKKAVAPPRTNRHQSKRKVSRLYHSRRNGTRT